MAWLSPRRSQIALGGALRGKRMGIATPPTPVPQEKYKGLAQTELAWKLDLGWRRKGLVDADSLFGRHRDMIGADTFGGGSNIA